MKSPCKDCEFREVGCHGKCDAYIQYSEYIAAQRVIKNFDGDTDSHKIGSVSTLLDILEKQVEESYFLSQEKTMQLLSKL